VRDALDALGVHTAFFGAPATSRNRSLARMTLHAALTEAELDHVEAAAHQVAQRVRPWEWAAARRQRGGAQLS
jgi:CAI-1 autoinducer synthase